jgi:hypothetical protein
LLVVAVVHHMVLIQDTHLEVEEQIHMVLDHLLVLVREVGLLVVAQQQDKTLALAEVVLKELHQHQILTLMLVKVVPVLSSLHILPK